MGVLTTKLAIVLSLNSRSANVLSLAILALACLIVFWRILDTLPTVMQDEYVYLVQAGHGAVSDSAYGNFLHSWIYSFVFIFGQDFYLVVKLLNVLFLLGFALSVWLVARQFLRPWVALSVGLISVLGPTSLYSSVFMPEMLFFALAGISMSLFVFSMSAPPHLRLMLTGVTGLTMALAALAKPQAVFLVIAALAFYSLVGFSQDHGVTRRGRLAATLVTTFLATKLGLGFLLAGNAGLTILGRNYEQSLFQFVNQLINFQQGSLSAAGPILNPVEGYGISSFVLFSAIHFFLLLVAFNFMSVGTFAAILLTQRQFTNYQLFVVVTIFTFLALVALFTALVTLGGDDHSNRLLGRYFEFLIPFVIIAGIVEIEKKPSFSKLRITWSLLGALITVAGSVYLLTATQQRLSDSAFILGSFRDPLLFSLVNVGVLLFALALVSRGTRSSSIPAVLLVVVFTFVGFSSQQRQLEVNGDPIPADIAGQSLAVNFESVPGDQLLVIGSNKQTAFVTKFWSQKSNVDHLIVQPGTQLPMSEINDGRYTLVVTLNGIRLSESPAIEVGDGYVIYSQKTGPGS